LSKTPDPNAGEPTVSFTYTPTGKRASMTDASGTTTYSYDSLDRLTMKATPEGTLNYTYDAASNLASMTSSDGNVSAAYTWDELNRLSTVVDHRLNGSNATTYTYDAASNLAAAAYPNGVQATFSYDTLNRLTGQSSRLGNYSYQLGPTGYAQAVEEAVNRSLQRSYSYGLRRIDVIQLVNNAWTMSFYGYDGFGKRAAADQFERCGHRYLRLGQI
jgi:YD repeat-containing protein